MNDADSTAFNRLYNAPYGRLSSLILGSAA